MQFVAIEDVQYAVTEKGSGPPLLFIHGFPLDHTMWRTQVDPFADAYRVITPDLRGFGQTAASGSVSMAQLADDLATLLDQLEIREPVILCGLSMGGYIAFEFVRRHRKRLRALVLSNTRATADTPEAAAGRLEMADEAMKHGSKAVAAAMEGKLFSPKTKQEKPEIVAAFRAVMERNSSQGLAAALRGMAERADSSNLLARIAVPTLVVAGQEDAIVGATEMEGMAHAIPGAEFVVVPDAGHLSPVENTNAFNQALKEFLSRR